MGQVVAAEIKQTIKIRKEIMKGLKFKLNKEISEKEGVLTILGWDFIKILDKTIVRKEKREDGWVYVYELLACGSDLGKENQDLLVMNENDFMEEVSYGIYQLVND